MPPADAARFTEDLIYRAPFLLAFSFDEDTARNFAFNHTVIDDDRGFVVTFSVRPSSDIDLVLGNLQGLSNAEQKQVVDAELDGEWRGVHNVNLTADVKSTPHSQILEGVFECDVHADLENYWADQFWQDPSVKESFAQAIANLCKVNKEMVTIDGINRFNRVSGKIPVLFEEEFEDTPAERWPPCLHVNLLKHSFLGSEREFLHVPYSIFRVIAVMPIILDGFNAKLVRVRPFRDNNVKGMRGLPLATWH